MQDVISQQLNELRQAIALHGYRMDYAADHAEHIAEAAKYETARDEYERIAEAHGRKPLFTASGVATV